MQGFNMGRHVPPDQEGTSSGNKLNKKRAPGTLRQDGTQTVRFEMPFAVWCHHCSPHNIIGQGVRFNAEKRKVGNYYSTPIWQFTVKHTTCGGLIEIRTDPQNTAYVVTSGGKARDYGDADDKLRAGQNGVPILTPSERDAQRNDAFAELEAAKADKALANEQSKRIDELFEQSQDWKDTWSANQRLRNTFRRKRKLLKRDEIATRAIQDRLGTDMTILPETEADASRAKLVTFATRPAQRAGSSAPAQEAKNILKRRVIGNTRANLDPFG